MFIRGKKLQSSLNCIKRLVADTSDIFCRVTLKAKNYNCLYINMQDSQNVDGGGGYAIATKKKKELGRTPFISHSWEVMINSFAQYADRLLCGPKIPLPLKQRIQKNKRDT